MVTLKEAIDDLLDPRRLSVEEAVDRHFVRAFRQRTNGTWEDRAAFVARIAELRGVIERVTVTVLDELVDGQRYAERHVIDVVQRDGTRAIQEVSLFAERAPDGRFVRLEEMTLKLEDEDLQGEKQP
ncbi:hypothetical protein SAMN05443572_115185 [Myxococcus fulvus]|uniref:SnoaL-like domain-containing protein n=1 Tax=Myxococcus fulvus TaxID=33 RepID=A0A511TDS7_MYXFU|nr:hypothetical protein [Myxococcus fulvus]GEN11823.1 hypothetical protein MFU01_68600 [Myxococcus fulvus]SEU40614.1 hypothetical protein SAMN05443572_115185 [Myxococcus fulvus]